MDCPGVTADCAWWKVISYSLLFFIISAGIIGDQPNLDLNYVEDANAQVDANFVICESGKIVEIQVTGEEYFFSDEQFQSIFTLAKKGISEIIQKQKEVLS